MISLFFLYHAKTQLKLGNTASNSRVIGFIYVSGDVVISLPVQFVMTSNWNAPVPRVYSRDSEAISRLTDGEYRA